MREIFPGWIKLVVLIVVALAIGFFASSFFLVKKSLPAPVVQEVKKVGPERDLVGISVEGRKIEAYTYRGQGLSSDDPSHPLVAGGGESLATLLFVGGIHGGYEWNSVLLAYELMNYLDANPSIVPANTTVTIIPNANPDGVFKVVGKEGRFAAADIPEKANQALGRVNANSVDLNRNFDCKWSPKGVWQKKPIGTGTGAFSEPESQALRNYIMNNKPAAAIFFHSQAGAVYASQCEKGILPETLNIMNTFAKASGYKAIKTFDSYAVNGASEDWLASQNIPAITVELTNHKDTEWEKNLLGIKALLEYYKVGGSTF